MKLPLVLLHVIFRFEDFADVALNALAATVTVDTLQVCHEMVLAFRNIRTGVTLKGLGVNHAMHYSPVNRQAAFQRDLPGANLALVPGVWVLQAALDTHSRHLSTKILLCKMSYQKPQTPNNNRLASKQLKADGVPSACNI